MQVTLSTDLADQLRRECGEDVFLCYQCRKCSSGCPLAEHFDLAPSQLIRALQFGLTDLVLKSRTIWLCAMCETCASRCPHQINITRIIDVLRIAAQREGIAPAVPAVLNFYQAANRSIRWFGRMYEAGMMGEFYLRQLLKRELDYGQLTRRDLPAAWKMVRQGKLKLLPHRGNPRTKDRAGGKDEIMAYYPGCSLRGTAMEYDLSTRAILPRLGIPFEEPDNWGCCGSTPAHSTDHFLATLNPLKNLSMVHAQGHRRLTTPCPSCFVRTKTAQRDMETDPVLRERVAAEIPNFSPGDLQVEHLLNSLYRLLDLSDLAGRIVRNFRDMPVVCYYGCLITRPPGITDEEDYEYPVKMDKIVQALGMKPLDWSYKTRCCGATHAVTSPRLGLELTARILRNAKLVGARAIVVACPLCQVNLDARQGQVNDEFGEDFHLPVLYFTQLIGWALGLQGDALGMDRHFVKPGSLLQELPGGQ
ncbi:MAG: heterodisulfide reductase-related iron-sulfur binding cluster [Smithellaceae bacterium]|nr:heterodisulfide reductase-related iron-sulfur binding cluster [Smithellaceae bacterium]